MNEDCHQELEARSQKLESSESSAGDWKEQLRRVHLNCAAQWAASANYWRGVAARYLVAGNCVMASEALFNATIREEYAAQDLAKAGVGVSNQAMGNIEHSTPNSQLRSPGVLRTAADGDVGAPIGKHFLN